MPSGAGSLDSEGIWLYGEADAETQMSDTLNLGQSATSAQFTNDRARLAALEDVPIAKILCGSETFSEASTSSNSDLGTAVTFPTLTYDTIVELEYIGTGNSNGSPSARTFWPNFIVTGSGAVLTQSVGSGDPVTVASGSTRGSIGQRAVLTIPAGISATAKLNVVVSAAAKVGAGFWRWMRHI